MKGPSGKTEELASGKDTWNYKKPPSQGQKRGSGNGAQGEPCSHENKELSDRCDCERKRLLEKRKGEEKQTRKESYAIDKGHLATKKKRKKET